MENITFTQRARKNTEQIYCIINDEILVTSWQNAASVLPPVDNLCSKVISDLINYGDCSFSCHGRHYHVFSNDALCRYIDVICNKDIVLMAKFL